MTKEQKDAIRGLLKKQGVTYKEIDALIRMYSYEDRKPLINKVKRLSLENIELRKALRVFDYQLSSALDLVKLTPADEIKRLFGLQK